MAHRVVFRPAALLLAMAVPLAVQAASFQVGSPTLVPGRPLPERHVLDGFGCHGANRSPALRWRGAPAGTRSFAVTVYDPDAPTGSGWWHWVVYNLPPTLSGLPEGAGQGGGAPPLPSGAVQGRTDFGTAGYGGACPPPGAAPHRYRFTVHALDVPQLVLPADASAAMVGFQLQAHRLDSAVLEVTYGR